jgi:hypothetical protein
MLRRPTPVNGGSRRTLVHNYYYYTYLDVVIVLTPSPHERRRFPGGDQCPDRRALNALLPDALSQPKPPSCRTHRQQVRRLESCQRVIAKPGKLLI